MTYLIYFTLALCGIIWKRSRLVTILIFVFVWILCWNESLPDYKSYEDIYRMTTFRDMGFAVLCALGNKIGLSFQTFYLSFFAIGVALYYRFIIKYAYCPGLVASMYLLFLCQLDIVQVRNFFAFGIYLFALPYLMRDVTIKNALIYCGITFLATTIHLTMAFFFVFYFVRKDIFKNWTLIIISAFIAILLFGASFYVDLSLDDERMADSEFQVSHFTMIAIIVMFGANLLYIIFMSSRKLKNNILPADMHKTAFLQAKWAKLLNTDILLLIPLGFRNLGYLRDYRFLGIINFVYCTNLICRMKKRTGMYILLFIYGLSYLLLTTYMHDMVKNVFPPLFEKNLLIRASLL